MGKSKSSKRFGARRLNPTGTVIDREIDLAGDNDSGTIPDVITNIIEQLHSPAKEERACGCQHLSRIVSHPRAIGILLEQDAIKITAPLFLDSSPDVQKSALGAMRNMSLFGEEEVCDAMVKNDVITPLSVVVKKFGENFDPDVEATKRDSPAILLEAVELLSNLCENSSRALQMFNKEGIVSILLSLLNADKCGYPLSNAVAHCLHVVSENNPEVSKVCREPGVLSQLMSFVSTPPSSIDAVLFRTRIIGTLLNLSEVDLSPYYDHFIGVIGEVLDMDSLPLISLAMEGNDSSRVDGNTEVDISQQDVDKLIAAQRDSLEMVANLCCFDDEWEEMEEDISEESCDDPLDCVEDAETPEEEIVESLCLPSEIYSAFVKHNLIAKVLKKAHPIEQSQTMLFEPSDSGKTILQRLQDLQARALLCLSNMISALYKADHSDQSQATTIVSVWAELYGLAKSYKGDDEDFMWAVTSAMRSVLQKMSEIDGQQIKNVTQEDLEFLVQIGTASKNPETQINVIRVVSTIGCVMAVDSEQHYLVKTIGEILLQVCSNNQDMVVISETLDSLFDVFKEDETDPVAKQIALVHHLKTFQPIFKAKVSSESKKLGQHYGIVMMAKSNLTAFVKYKMKRHL